MAVCKTTIRTEIDRFILENSHQIDDTILVGCDVFNALLFNMSQRHDVVRISRAGVAGLSHFSPIGEFTVVLSGLIDCDAISLEIGGFTDKDHLNLPLTK